MAMWRLPLASRCSTAKLDNDSSDAMGFQVEQMILQAKKDSEQRVRSGVQKKGKLHLTVEISV